MNQKKYLMSQTILLRIYKTMKRNPKKVYVLTDFHLKPHLNRVYMSTLVKLGLIEECEVIYKVGVKLIGCKNTHGYKFKKENDK
jgi:hypothetical protein